MSKAAQASFHITSAQELATLKAQIEEQKQIFNKLHRELQQVVKDDPQLNKSSLEVEKTYQSFSNIINSLLKDKNTQLVLNKKLKAQLETVELAAEDANSMVLVAN